MTQRILEEDEDIMEFEDAGDDVGDGFIHVLDTDDSVSIEETLGENLEDDVVAAEEDLSNWNMTSCPKCRGKFDMLKCRTSGENIICPHCHAYL
jgi:hypothetical protein